VTSASESPTNSLKINDIKRFLREGPLKREMLNRSNRGEFHRADPWFFARDVDECPVKVWLRRTGQLPSLADLPSKPTNIILWGRGRTLEQEVIDSLKIFLPSADSRVPTLKRTYFRDGKPLFSVAGRPDLLYRGVVFEVKSTSEERYGEIRTLDDCYQSWKDQVYMYQDMFSVPEAYLIVVNRNRPVYRVLRVPFDEDRFNWITCYFTELEQMVQRGEVPQSENCWPDCPCKIVELGVTEESEQENENGEEAREPRNTDPPHSLPSPR
jgi:hypothetical protein